MPTNPRVAVLLSAALAATSCGGPNLRGADGRAREAPAAAPGPAPEAPSPPPAAPPLATAPPPGPLYPLPDRSQAPWSRTPVSPIGIGDRVAGHEDGGAHLRLGTTGGVVHVWTPPGYAPRSAGVVIYLHGYYANADQAWADHKLATQFRASGRNALYVVPESPAWNGEDVWWPELGTLLAEVVRLSGLALPKGPVVLVGHSGAFRTVLPWLADPRVEEVVLLDGLYRGEGELEAWLAASPAERPRRLVLVGLETAQRTEAWLKGRTDAVRRERIPSRPPGPKEPERTARIVYLRSQHDHMKIVTNGRVMPLVLRMTRLRGT